jgi:uncharacterized membrane protein
MRQPIFAHGKVNMFGIIGLLLLILWLGGFFAFHVTAGFIHILLVLALISIVYHFLAGRSTTA